ncbi:MAG TPA: hypothetical protein VGU23_10095 [Acidobacteriaceae bacterium]|nr:hypothetical protein [Acidobacteriaceae bacterium]
MVWLAAPARREWAEGLEREVAEIDSDWTALRWAIGGLRVVLDRRKPPIRSLAEVQGEARALVKQLRRGGVPVLVIGQVPMYVEDFFFHPTTLPHCLGCLLLVFGALMAATILSVDWRRMKLLWKDDAYNDPFACALLYRAELKRHLLRLRVQMLSLACLMAGILLVESGSFWAGSVFKLFITLFWVPFLLILYSRRRDAARRIEELDGLLGSTAE